MSLKNISREKEGQHTVSRPVHIDHNDHLDHEDHLDHDDHRICREVGSFLIPYSL